MSHLLKRSNEFLLLNVLKYLLFFHFWQEIFDVSEMQSKSEEEVSLPIQEPACLVTWGSYA